MKSETKIKAATEMELTETWNLTVSNSHGYKYINLLYESVRNTLSVASFDIISSTRNLTLDL